MFYDLHIHSALSACADDDMTPNNIVNMAIIKGLDIIAVCDHNSCLQQIALEKVAQGKPIQLIYGVEVNSQEEVHILCYFRKLSEIMMFEEWLKKHRPPIANRPQFFGNQLLYDENDQCIGQEEICLSLAISASVKEIILQARKNNGRCVYAHAVGKSHGIIRQLGMIPNDCPIDGIEITDSKHREMFASEENYLFLFNSDAHQLCDISEPVHQLTEIQWQHFWEGSL